MVQSVRPKRLALLAPGREQLLLARQEWPAEIEEQFLEVAVLHEAVVVPEVVATPEVVAMPETLPVLRALAVPALLEKRELPPRRLPVVQLLLEWKGLCRVALHHALRLVPHQLQQPLAMEG